VLTYVTTLTRATRPQTKGVPDFITKFVHCGAGPRAAQNLVLGAKARAVMHGRPNVSINDVRAVAIPVLRHRVFTNFAADAEGVTPMSLVEQLLKAVPEPKVEDEKSIEAEGVAPSPNDMVLMKCPQCAKTVQFTRAALGRKAKCHACGAVFVVEEVAV
jgi:MoxR-like ATPase